MQERKDARSTALNRLYIRGAIRQLQLLGPAAMGTAPMGLGMGLSRGHKDKDRDGPALAAAAMAELEHALLACLEELDRPGPLGQQPQQQPHQKQQQQQQQEQEQASTASEQQQQPQQQQQQQQQQQPLPPSGGRLEALSNGPSLCALPASAPRISVSADWVHIFHSVLPALPLNLDGNDTPEAEAGEEARMAAALRAAAAGLLAKHSGRFRQTGVAVWEVRLPLPGERRAGELAGALGIAGHDWNCIT